jgi:hypothetical protein
MTWRFMSARPYLIVHAAPAPAVDINITPAALVRPVEAAGVAAAAQYALQQPAPDRRPRVRDSQRHVRQGHTLVYFRIDVISFRGTYRVLSVGFRDKDGSG